MLDELNPDQLISAAGDFLGIDDLPAFQESLRALLRQVIPTDTPPEVLKEAVALATSREVVESLAATEWNVIVGFWLDAELELGAEYISSTKEPIGLFDGEPVAMNYTFSARRLLPCRRDGANRTCVELELRSIADPADMKRAIESFASRFAYLPTAKQLVFQTLVVETRVLLVTEPDGMAPHRYTMTRSGRGTAMVEGEKQEVEQFDETRVTYSY